MKKVLYAAYIFISILLGGLGFYLFFVMADSLGNNDGLITLIPPPWESTLLFSIIFVLGISLLPSIIYNKTWNKRLIVVALLVSLSSFILTALYSIYSVDIKHSIESTKAPSHESQALIRGEVQRIIEGKNLPYIIDSKGSEEWTQDEPKRYVVLLRKVVQGSIEPMEVELVLKSLSSIPNVELKLVFYDLNKKENVSIIISKEKEIKSCNPIEYCK